MFWSVGLDTDQAENPVSQVRGRSPDLGAIDDPFVAIEGCRRASTREVAARVGL